MLKHPDLIIAIAALLPVLLVNRNVRVTGPHSLTRTVSRRVSRRPVVVWRDGPFLGWARSTLGLTRWAFGSREDTVAIVGPPRISGKTAGVVIPQAAMWNGALVTTSTKPDVLHYTAARRLELARQHGGCIYVYAPTAAGAVEGIEPMRWSPLAGCDDPLIAAARVDALVQVADVGKNVENADHWRSGAARILRAYFLAAAHHPERPGDFSVVTRWISLHEFREPLAILAALRVDGAQEWAADLLGIAERTNEKERSSFFAAASTSLKVTAVPRVLRSCGATDIDPEEFVRTRSTLYIISPSEYQTQLAPLCAALVESIVFAAYRLHDADGRPRTSALTGIVRGASNLWRLVTGQQPLRAEEGPARLLLQLDELTNIAPVPSLETIVSQGAGRGVLICWIVQSLAQVRNRYGDATADAIWSASTCKVVFGGLSDVASLDHISRLIGDQMVPTRTISTDSEGKRSETRGHEWRPRLAPSQLRELRRSWALLLYHHGKPSVLRTPIAARKRRMARAVVEWSGSAVPRTAVRPASIMPAQPAAWPEIRPHVVNLEPPATPVPSANGGGAEVEG